MITKSTTILFAVLITAIIATMLIVYWSLGQSASKETKNTILPQPTSTSDQVQDLYTHPKYNFSFSYPKDWKLGEYTGRTSFDLEGKTVLYVAVDPVAVSTQEEFETLDKPMGMASVSLSDVEAVTLSGYIEPHKPNKTASGLDVYVIKQTYDDLTASNPWWQNMVSENYFIVVPENARRDGYKTLSVLFAYPISSQNDQTLQAQLQNIIDSISFSNLPPN